MAYYLALIGGIPMIVFGLLGIFAIGAYYFYWGFAFEEILTLIMRIIAVIRAKSVKTLTWAIVLMGVGLIGGPALADSLS